MYVNPAGPGDYEMPPYMSIDAVTDSTRRSAPRYSIQSKTKIPYFKEYSLEFINKTGPGVGKYTPSESFTKEHSPDPF